MDFVLSKTPRTCQPQHLWCSSTSLVSCSEGLWRGSPIPTPTAPWHPGTQGPLQTPHSCRDLVKAMFSKTQALQRNCRLGGTASVLTERCFGNSPTAAFLGAVFNRELLPLSFQMPFHALTQQEVPALLTGLSVCSQDTHFCRTWQVPTETAQSWTVLVGNPFEPLCT